ncbi:MAG: ABC-2 transporter permease [Anaerolineaceae bacterium]|nr:ABC-2 transporter permease [Anaerolineaceae bacterium]
MNGRILWYLLHADFLERARRSGIWLVAALGIGFGVLFLPPTDSQTLMVALGPWRGVYNSAWVGLVFGLLAVMLLPLFAFYPIKNSLGRDRQTRVGQIIATTPVSRPQYLLGKWLSNVAVLAILLLVLSVMALVMQLWRGEAAAVQLTPLLAPLWLLGLPVMALVAALALLFESVPLLTGGVGNVIYFFGWLFFLNNLLLPGLFRAQVGLVTPGADVLGITRPLAALQVVAAQIDPAYSGHFNIAGASYGRLPTVIFWEGMDWTTTIAAERLAWLLTAVGLVLATSLVFDRFDPARQGMALQLKRKRPATSLAAEEGDTHRLPAAALPAPAASLTRPSLFTLLRAELALLVHGRSRWLRAAAAVATLLSLVAPPGDGPPVGALVWVWPVLLWSELGTRAQAHHTRSLVYAAPEPRRAQFWAAWLAGVTLALAATAVPGLRALVSGNVGQGLGMMVGVLFVPSLALACGVWSGNGRLFQVLYLLGWFAAAGGNHWLDFMAFHAETAASGIPLVYLVAAVAAVGLAWLGEIRNEQI